VLHKLKLPHDQVGFWLILASSILLGIWAMKDTIALRNLLLGFSAVTGLIYIYLTNKNFNTSKLFSFGNIFPFTLILILLTWILSLSLHADSFNNHIGTWLRCILAPVVGGSVGIALIRNPSLVFLLWIGILTGFLVVLFQYLQAIDGSSSLYFIDWNGTTYSYIGKMNAVLMGGMLIAGCKGSSLDLMKCYSTTVNFFLFGLIFSILCLLSYLFIFVFDSKSGVGVIIIISILNIILFGFKSTLIKNKVIKVCFTIIVLSSFLVTSFAYIASDEWWTSLVEDIQISSEVDKNLAWMQANGIRTLPKRSSGEFVSGNVYERTAWSIIGLREIRENPIGTGVIEFPLKDLLQKKYPGAIPFSSHSAWIELTLSFGWFFITTIFLIFILNVVKTFKNINSYFRYLTLNLTFIIILIYSFGELNTEHGLEILFFFLGLLSFIQLNLDNKKKILCMSSLDKK
jgi:hypothetical protein